MKVPWPVPRRRYSPSPSVAVVPDDLLALFVPIYEGSVAALKKQIEG